MRTWDQHAATDSAEPSDFCTHKRDDTFSRQDLRLRPKSSLESYTFMNHLAVLSMFFLSSTLEISSGINHLILFPSVGKKSEIESRHCRYGLQEFGPKAAERSLWIHGGRRDRGWE